LTEITAYICDMCGSGQQLNTQPKRMETNFVRFTGMVANLDRSLSIQALCPKCAGIVGQFIKENKTKKDSYYNTEIEKENRVSTIR
jgi:hypothetical protein